MGREIRGNAGLHHGNLAPIPATPRRMERERDIYSGGIENFLKKVLENLDMNDEKFKLRIIEVVALLIKFRKMTDKSDKRILRDYIRAVVKELTLV